MGDVVIIEMDRGFSVVSWLCPKHIAARRRKGWLEKWRKSPPHELDCDDCRAGRLELPGGAR